MVREATGGSHVTAQTAFDKSQGGIDRPSRFLMPRLARQQETRQPTRKNTMLAQPSIAAGLLCLVFGIAAVLRSRHLFMSRRDRCKAVARLYQLTAEETTRRRFHAARRLAA
jgi:hypothetical protein